jgi:hypothetical protein
LVLHIGKAEVGFDRGDLGLFGQFLSFFVAENGLLNAPTQSRSYQDSLACMSALQSCEREHQNGSGTSKNDQETDEKRTKR